MKSKSAQVETDKNVCSPKTYSTGSRV